MVSVVARAKEVKQPLGGYLRLNQFDIRFYEDNKELFIKENISPSLVGLVVDYMSRFLLSESAEDKLDAFKIPLLGSKIIGDKIRALSLFKSIKGSDDKSIISAVKLVGYDVIYRAGVQFYKPVTDINPSKETIKNIKIMIDRSLVFIKEYGPITKHGFTFEKKGYTSIVDKGDGDFLTESVLWDFKVSKYEPRKESTLQILMYYLMGKRSIHTEFQSIEQLGLFNPRLNKVYLIKVSDIPKETILEVEQSVIGFKSK